MAPLVRNRNRYEFFVRYGMGFSAISGSVRAARHFGLHTRNDPTAAGGDDYRVIVDRDRARVLEAARVLARGYDGTDEARIAEAECWFMARMAAFCQDWKHWDLQNDRNTWGCLGFDFRVFASPGCSFYRVVIRRQPRGRVTKT